MADRTWSTADGRAVRDESRMSELEALMWSLDADPHLRGTFANVTVLDRTPDHEYLRRKLGRAVAEIARLRQRVVPAIGRLAPPSWEEDPEFDLDHHLRWRTLGSEEDLLTLAARIHQEPLDRDRPLWEFTVIDGLPDGRAAMIQKLHHTVTDGVGGLRLAERFLDLERSPTEPTDVPTWAPSADPAPAGGGLLGRAAGTVGHLSRQVATATVDVARGAADALTHPVQWPTLAADASETTRSLLRQAVTTDRARSPLWTERSLATRLEVLRVPFDPVKARAQDRGVTINDIFVTAACRAAATVHRDVGRPVDELRMAMPVSTRDDASAAGNSFALTRTLVPVGVVDPAEHLLAVHDALTSVRKERAFHVIEQLAGLVNVLPTGAVVLAARRQAETVDFTTSNLRGAPFPVYFGGGRVVENYPVGPLGGTAFNLTMLSYAGELHLGLLVDEAAVADAGALRAALAVAFDELT